jgi:4-hydroxybenzoate polyprenyltransferase
LKIFLKLITGLLRPALCRARNDASSNPYITLARLHRPIGVWLLLFPCWWGMALASSSWPSLFLLGLFACGAVLMRSAGCVYNDLIDRDLDRQVRRTALRPLAKGELSTKEATLFLTALLLGGALVLFSLPLPVILTGFIALALVLLYPWMKQITYWPQLFLGLTFNIGILMGWLSLHSTLSLAPFLFYGGAIFWTMGYDTIYGFQDREDDLLVGIKSSAIIVATLPKTFLSVVYGGALLLWTIGGILAHLTFMYWFFLTLIMLHFIWQIVSLKENVSANCLQRFDSNAYVGLFLLLGIVFSHVIN